MARLPRALRAGRGNAVGRLELRAMAERWMSQKESRAFLLIG